MKNNFFLIQDIVNSYYTQNNVYIDHLKISNDFMAMLKKDFNDEEFIDLLICTGYIPDLYPSDSSQETLYSKLIEVLVCEWAQRIGLKSKFVKQKSSYEDVTIFLDNNAIVCDAKSFRLGRSQKAPNVKDFLKLEDIRKWLSRYDKKLGGLVTYPCRHEWSTSSDAYQYCTTKDAPTLMLPYKYLAFLLKYKNKYSITDLKSLWDYKRLFPSTLTKNIPGGNKVGYWNVINNEIKRITHVSQNEFNQFFNYAENLITKCIQANLEILTEKKNKIIENITTQVNSVNDINVLKKEIIQYKIASETDYLNSLISRIYTFRIDEAT